MVLFVSVVGFVCSFLVIVPHGSSYSFTNSVVTQGTYPGAENKSHFYKSSSSTSLLPPHFLILSNPGDENKK